MTEEQDKISLFESILDSLTHLVAGSDERRDMMFPKAALSMFDGFELFDPRLGRHDEVLFARDVSDAPVWPMDARYAFPKTADEIGERAGAGWLFARVSTLDMKRWRGRVRLTFPRMVEISEAFVNGGGVAWSSMAPVGLVKDKAIDCMAHNHPQAGSRVSMAAVYDRSNRSDSGDASEDDLKIRLSHGIELRREYLWSVLLGEEGVPRARFVTDPTGVREAFRLRDIPAGKARRAALRHWVRDHWRKSRDPSADEKTFVRAYLRGATDFGWNGLGCTIEPSREDARLAAADRR